jgi:hypothetical protein
MKHNFLFFTLTFLTIATNAQPGYWQQHVDYKMEVEVTPANHQYTGTQTLVYTNNSPDTLHQVFYHLYPNAFQPGSMMDVRSQNIPDPDRRIGKRIANLKENEIGYLRVNGLTQNGLPVFYDVQGTVLQAKLAQPILPGEKATFELQFIGQVPVQIRRSGRNNKEEIDYTMTQWYPKMAAYDRQGWHPDQYVGREFYGEFGTFDVKITLPANYVVGGTGVLQNPEVENPEALKGKKKISQTAKKTWHFVAENVHDFAWAADPDFVHEQFTLPSGTQIHLYYNPKTARVENWQKSRPDIEKFFAFMAEKFGPYAYPQFSLIQGGDGGMEYPMCTMMLGSGKSYKGFFGLFVHEAAHNWFYGMLGSNEQRYPWMDEGFTSFAEEEAMNFIFKEGKYNAHLSGFGNYKMADSLGILEPLATPADYFERNMLYSLSAYSRGELFLMQLQYIVGEDASWRSMQKFYTLWHFKHPTPEDFLKVVEDESGLQLDWFYSRWVYTTKATDYAIKSTETMGPSTRVILQNLGTRPMPVDVMVTLKNGSQQFYTIPLRSMYGAKEQAPYTNLPPWPWTNPTYELFVPFILEDIDSITLDPWQQSCDINTRNNHWVKP